MSSREKLLAYKREWNKKRHLKKIAAEPEHG